MFETDFFFDDEEEGHLRRCVFTAIRFLRSLHNVTFHGVAPFTFDNCVFNMRLR